VVAKGSTAVSPELSREATMVKAGSAHFAKC
jgi:hypothetical protein